MSNPAQPLPMMSMEARCALHPPVAAPWRCGLCQRGHCEACKGRLERRLTPAGTCLQCGGPLQPVPSESATLDELGLRTPLSRAYQPLGLMSATALSLPMLLAGVLPFPTVILAAVWLTATGTWTYFLAVVRWRALGHVGMPNPMQAAEDLRSSVSLLGGLLASLIASLPLLLGLMTGLADGPGGVVQLLLLACVTAVAVPLPILAAAASSNPLGPLVPLRGLAVLRDDKPGYVSMAATLAALASTVVLAVTVAGWTVGKLPILGRFLTSVAVLPLIWAMGLVLGRYGQKHGNDLGFDD